MVQPKKKKELTAQREQLEAVLSSLGYSVMRGRGNFREGTCLVESEKKLVINQFTPLDLQVNFLIQVLRQQDLSNVYLRPRIRELIEKGA